MTSRPQVRAALLACFAAGAAAACSGSDGVASPGEAVFVPSPPAAPPASPPAAPPASPPATGPAASCPTGTTNVGVVANQRNCSLPAKITGSLNLPKQTGVIYSISGRVDVGDDRGADPAAPIAGAVAGTLSIDPGVTVFGSSGSDYMVVNRGSQLVAVGSASAPIIMTSRQSVEGTTGIDSIGQWGGLVILGRAPTNSCPSGVAYPNVLCTAQVEGASVSFYGGNTPNDNSGQLRFFRLMHSGFKVDLDNELNGITLAGVGAGTTIENVQVHNSSDDGIEIFGGTVNLRNIVLTGNDDDGFDLDNGWRGATQNLLVISAPTRGDFAFEFGSKGLPARFSQPTITNATLIKQNAGTAVNIKEGFSMKLYNSLVVANGPCIDFDGQSTIDNGQTFRSVALTCAGGNPFVNNAAPASAAQSVTLFDAATTANLNNSALVSTLTNTFVNGANENGIAVTTTPTNADIVGGFTFAATTNVGASGPGNNSWYSGWTCGLPGGTAC